MIESLNSNPRVAPTLSPQVSADIADFYLRKFETSISDVLRTLVYGVVRIGLETNPHASALTSPETKLEFEAVARAMSQHVADAQLLRARIAQATLPEEKIALLHGTVQPFLAALEETGNRGMALNKNLVRAAEAKTERTFDSDNSSIENSVRYFREAIASMAYFNTRQIGTSDLNFVTCKFRHYVSNFEPHPEQPQAYVVAHDFQFALDRFFTLFTNERHNAICRAFREASKNNEIFAQLDADLSESPARQLIQAAFLHPEKGSLKVEADGTIRISYEVPPILRSQMAPAVHAMREGLEPASELLSYQNSPLHLRYSTESGLLSLTIETLALADPTSKNLAHIESIIATDKFWNSFPDAMSPLVLLREVKKTDGTVVPCEISLQGAALNSERAWKSVSQTLRHFDNFIEQCPGFTSLELMALGDEDSILQVYENGNYQVLLRSSSQSPFFTVSKVQEGPVEDYKNELRFPWQKEEKSSEQLKEVWAELVETGDIAMIEVGGREFAMGPIRQAAVRVCKVATPIQLSINHQQEQEVQKDAEHLNPLLRKMLQELEHVLSTLQGQRPDEKLSFMLCNIMSMRVSEIGQHDFIYSLSVHNEKQELIAQGSFSRSRRSFVWKETDQHIEKQCIARIERALKKCRGESDIHTSTVEEALLNADIFLPNEVISRATDALNQVSRDDIFIPPTLKAVLQQALRDPQYLIALSPERLTVRERE